MNTKEHLGLVIEDILKNGLKIKQFVADNLKRAIAKDSKNHSSWYAFEYCYAKGIKIEVTDNTKARQKLIQQKKLIEEKIAECRNNPNVSERTASIENLTSLRDDIQKSINSFQRKSNILWPSSTFVSEHRSRQSILDIVNKIQNGEELSVDECRGIVGRSLLLDIPDFNFVYDTPAEYLHCCCLGVIKRLTELTFSVGINRPRITKRKLSSTSEFNRLMLQTKVPEETSRRARSLDFSVFKGQEF